MDIKLEQAKLYPKRAQMVLDTVKVGYTISLTLESVCDKLKHNRGKSIRNCRQPT